MAEMKTTQRDFRVDMSYGGDGHNNYLISLGIGVCLIIKLVFSSQRLPFAWLPQRKLFLL